MTNELQAAKHALSAALAAQRVTEPSNGDTLEDNVRYLIDSTPAQFIVRVRPKGGDEDLIGTLCVTYRKMQDAALSASARAPETVSDALRNLLAAPTAQRGMEPTYLQQFFLAVLGALNHVYGSDDWQRDYGPKELAAAAAAAIRALSAPARAPETVSDADIRRVFLAHGFTIKEGCDDLKPYVYEAARALLAEAKGEKQ